MKILLTVFSPSTGTFGGLTRLFAIAKIAVENGHSVEFAASGNVVETIRNKGFKVNTLPEATMFGLPKFLSKIVEKRSQRVQIPVKEGKAIGSIWFVFFLAGLLKFKYLRRLIESQIAIYKKIQPNLIITEMDFASYLSAYIKKIPLVTTYAKVSEIGENTFPWKKALKVTNKILKIYGLTSINNSYDLLLNKKVLKIIPNIALLDGTDAVVDTVYFSGNLIEPIKSIAHSFKLDESKRNIFVYLGTGSVSFKIVEKVMLESFSKYPDVICYVASQGIKENYSIKNIRFMSYVPSELLMPTCDLFICHGGLNSITQSLEAGVPLLMFPGPIFERRYNSQMVQMNKAGKMGEISDFNASWICNNYDNLNNFTIGVKTLQEQFKSTDGVNGAYQKIIDWYTKLNSYEKI